MMWVCEPTPAETLRRIEAFAIDERLDSSPRELLRHWFVALSPPVRPGYIVLDQLSLTQSPRAFSRTYI